MSTGADVDAAHKAEPSQSAHGTSGAAHASTRRAEDDFDADDAAAGFKAGTDPEAKRTEHTGLPDPSDDSCRDAQLQCVFIAVRCSYQIMILQAVQAAR